MNMPVLIKKNKTLVVVLIATFICSLFLIYECFVTYDTVQSSMKLIEQDDDLVKKINKKSNPNPVKRSAVIIEDNTEKLRAEIRTLRRCIGSPYREQLLSFLANIESSAFLRSADEAKNAKPAAAAPAAQVPAAAAPAEQAGNAEAEVPAFDFTKPLLLHYTEDSIFAIFRTVYQDYYADRVNTAAARDNDLIVNERKEIFEKFRMRLAQPPEGVSGLDTDELRAKYTEAALKTFDKAFNRFRQDVQAKTIETIDEVDARFIMMSALGLERTMTSLQCKYLVDEFQTHIEKNPSLIPGLAVTSAAEKKPIQQRIPMLTYNHNNALPPPGNVVHILRHYQIIEDLYARMRESKIRILHNIASPLSPKPSGDLGGDPVKDMGSDFKRFIYSVTITSSGNEIRNFVNNLHGAFKDNRIYDIQEISLFKMPQADEVKGANEKKIAWEKSLAEQIAQNHEAEKKPDEETAAKPGDPGEAAEETKKSAVSVEPRVLSESDLNLIYSNTDYGVPILGNNDLVTAVIKFNYIVYVGNNIGKN